MDIEFANEIDLPKLYPLDPIPAIELAFAKPFVLYEIYGELVE